MTIRQSIVIRIIIWRDYYLLTVALYQIWCSDSALRNFSRCHDSCTPLHTVYVPWSDIVRTGFHSCTLLRIFVVNDLTLRPRNSILYFAKSTNSLTRYIRNYERSTCLWQNNDCMAVVRNTKVWYVFKDIST
jgi:hypothetical protein